MNILFLTSRFPYPPRGGDRLRVYNFLKVLAKRHRVTLLALVDRPVPADDLRSLQRYVAHCEIVVLPKWQSYLNCVAGLFSAKPLQVHYYRSPLFRLRLHAILQTQKFDLGFIHLFRMAEYAQEMNGVPKVLDLTDALSMNYERAAQFGPRQFLGLQSLSQHLEVRRVRRYEAEMIAWFERSLLISPVDRDYLQTFVPTDRVHVIGAGVDLEYFAFYEGDYDPNRIVFLGKMSTIPNRDAIHYFVQEIMPRIHHEIPAVKLSIVGIEPTADILALQQPGKIEVTGEVQDVRPYLRRAALSVCPMRLGAGAKNKILESLAIGTPVVSTTVGVEGFAIRDEKALLIGDTPETFAEKTIAVMRSASQRRTLARAGRALMEEKYSWQMVLRDLETLVDSFLPQTQATPAPSLYQIVS